MFWSTEKLFEKSYFSLFYFPPSVLIQSNFFNCLMDLLFLFRFGSWHISRNPEDYNWYGPSNRNDQAFWTPFQVCKCFHKTTNKGGRIQYWCKIFRIFIISWVHYITLQKLNYSEIVCDCGYCWCNWENSKHIGVAFLQPDNILENLITSTFKP